LAQAVNDTAVARAEAINREGLRLQVDYMLETHGPGEIEAVVRNRANTGRP
jgi:hypothetical protein